MALLSGTSSPSKGVRGRALGVRWAWTVGDGERGGNGGTAGTSSVNKGVDLELEGECLGTGADTFLVKFDEGIDFSTLLSGSDCGCDGELDLCEEESTVEAGEGGARGSSFFPGAMLGRLSFGDNAGAISFFLVPLRLYHLSFPTPLFFGDVGPTDGLPGIDGIASSLLLSCWCDETLAGDEVLPEVDELVDTERASSFSLTWPLIFTEGTCRNECNSPT